MNLSIERLSELGWLSFGAALLALKMSHSKFRESFSYNNEFKITFIITVFAPSLDINLHIPFQQTFTCSKSIIEILEKS